MKILYVAADQTLSGYHGGTVHVLSVANELGRHGHSVHVAFQKTEQQPLILPDSNLELHPLRKRHRFLLWQSGSEVQRILDNVVPDVVLERYYNFSGEAVIRANRMKIPSVLEVNSPMIEYPGSLKTRIDPLLSGRMLKRRNRIAHSASMIIVPLKEIIPEEFQHKVREIEWGVDAENFDPAILPDRERLRKERGFDPQDVLLIHFGSLRKWHGLPKLLKAFEQAQPRFEQAVKLVVAGPSQKRKSSNIHFHGEVPHSDLPSWLKMSDIAVLPFSPEKHPYLKLGFYWSPLKLFEAMAMEMPLITLEHPRLRSLLGTEDSGLYFDGTVENLTQKMIDMVNNLSVYKEKAKQFRRRIIENYSWQQHGLKLNRWLEEIRNR